MSTVRPRQVLHRGSVPACGIVFSLEFGRREIETRVLAMWQPGARLRALDQHRWILTWPRVVRMRALDSGGALLAQSGDAMLSAAPLTEAERDALANVDSNVVVTEAGHARSVALGACAEIDPAAWLALDEWTVAAPVPLASESVLEIEAPAPVRDVRDVLGDAVPAPDPAREALLAEMKAGERGRGLAARPRGVSAISRIRAWLRSGRGLRGAARTASRQASHTSRAAPIRSYLQRAFDWISARFSQMVYWSRLSRMIGARQARYFQNVIEMFERGDLGEALRHAIPLGQDAKTSGTMRFALSVPGRRHDLTLSMHAHVGPRSVLPVGDRLLALMRQYYERAARALVEQGRIEEAAFTWAELLGDVRAAIATLEAAGLLHKAAELAQSREVEPGLIVRQWIIAGDIERAVAIANRHRAYADAVARLETNRPDAARRLRLLWSDALASAGDYAGAVDAIWPIEEARSLARAFLERALEAGGAQTGRSLARLLALAGGEAREELERLRVWLSDAGPETAPARLAFASAALDHKPTPALRVGVRAVLRALWADFSAGSIKLDRSLRNRLLELANDSALRADVPSLTARSASKLGAHGAAIAMRIEAHDAGTIAVSDALLLANGGLLVALGEAGMRVYRRDLRSFTALSEPAHHLVSNPECTRVIAIADRGSMYKLARVDSVSRQCQAWCEVQLDRWAPEFDGTHWFVAFEDSLIAIDATRAAWRGTWRLRNVSGRVRDGIADICVSEYGIDMLVQGVDGSERWSYEPSTLKLRARSAVSAASDARIRFAERLRPGHVQVACLALDPDGDDLAVVLRSRDVYLTLCKLTGYLEHFDIQLRENWAAITFWNGSACQVLLVDIQRRCIVLNLTLAGARRARIRLTADHLLAADDAGRVRVMSLHNGEIVVDHRVVI